MIFVTKYRHKVFSNRHPTRPEEIMRAVCAGFGTELVEFNGKTGVSSRRIRQEFPELARHYWRAQRLWPDSYFAGSAGGARSPYCASTSSSKTDRSRTRSAVTGLPRGPSPPG
jgi:putative transposase